MTLLDLFVLLLMSENNLEVEYIDEHVSYLGSDAWVSCETMLEGEVKSE